MLERTFTATEILAALHAERETIDELHELEIITCAEAKGRQTGLVSLAKSLGLGESYVNYDPQEAGK